MSSDSARRSTPEEPAKRSPLFELHEKPLPPPPRPLKKLSGVFDDPPELRPRTGQAAIATTVRKAPLRLIPDDPDDDLHDGPRTPLAESAAHLDQAYQMASYRRGPPSSRLPLLRSSPGDLFQHHPILMIAGVILCVGVLMLAFLPQPRTIISRFGGTISSASNPIAKSAPNLPTPPGEHSLLGDASISAEQADRVLAEFGSPAAGTGQIWIRLGQKYGINPAYALAFFIHESSAGTNPGWAGIKPGGGTTHNIGNIICAGYATCFGRFRDYQSWEEGIEDWYELIADEYVADRGAHTIEQIIPIYAPSFENNVPAYVQAVTGMVEQWQPTGAAP